MQAASSIKRRIKLKLVFKLLRLIQRIRQIGFNLLSTAHYCGNPAIHQPVQFVGEGKISFGQNIHIGVFPSPFYLSGYGYIESRYKSSLIEIGDNTWINNNFVAIAEHSSIKIGKNVLIGTNVEIYDSDFHGLEREQRRISDPVNAKPVMIGDDVFIGSNVKILKGVTIGQGSVIANGSIVTSNIDMNVIAGGMPAKILRKVNCRSIKG